MRQIDFFDQGVARAPDAPCLVGPDHRLTFSEARALSRRIAHALARDGVTAVGTLSPNHPLGFAAILGVFRAEALSLALNVRSAVKDNATHLNLGCAQLLLYHGDMEAQARELAAHVPTLRAFVCIDREGALGPSLDAWTAGLPDEDPPLALEDPTRVYRITVTGGTTGSPKGVQHAHVQAEVNTSGFLATLRYDRTPRFLMAAPMTHAAGLVSFHVLAQGGSVHFLDKTEPAGVLEHFERETITTTVMPPTLLYNLLADPTVRRRDHAALRYLLVGTAPVSAEKLKESVEVFGPVLGQLYGQSECPMATFLSPQDVAEAVSRPERAHLLRSCGRPLPATLMAIMDPQGRLLPDGEKGELVVRSNQVMRGYLGQPGATAECSTFGWHHTSDVGWRDAEGYFYIVDRKRDLIISGGFNVFPSEVEQVIWSHPAVHDCAVIGVPDDKWGEAVKAVVMLKAGAALTEDDLIAFCRAQLGAVKTPKTVEFWLDLPRSPLGKVLKREVRDRFWVGAGRVI